MKVFVEGHEFIICPRISKELVMAYYDEPWYDDENNWVRCDCGRHDHHVSLSECWECAKWIEENEYNNCYDCGAIILANSPNPCENCERAEKEWNDKVAEQRTWELEEATKYQSRLVESILIFEPLTTRWWRNLREATEWFFIDRLRTRWWAFRSKFRR